MNLNSTISGMDPKLQGKGFIIAHDQDLTPRVVPTPQNYFGISEGMGHILWIMAMDIIYKFQCEDFTTDNFQETKRFIKAYSQQLHQSKPWFPSVELRKLRKDPEKFFKIFKFTLQEDMKRYYGRAAQGMIKDMLQELEKVTV